MKNCVYIIVLLFFSGFVWAQNSLERFLKPSDTLNKNRLQTLVISEIAIGGATLIGLNQIWYADYPRSKFHFINDNDEWLQMDKMGHLFSAYHLGSLGAQALKWSGADKKRQLIYGSTLGLVFLTAVEVFDGYSANWGASPGDVIANVSGTALYVSQELLWNEQRVIPKFSFHTTSYAKERPEVLGSSISEQILKDYNGQTYWLSANLHSFAKQSKIPKWLNVAVGYGAEGMITGTKDDLAVANSFPESKRYRQFYLSLDVDLTKIETKSHFLKTILTVFNSIKIPAPAFEINGLGDSKLHFIYF
ncbi:DUF2279 domain-containing protein [Flavobacterium silvisoli]|uniref:DUF2279 domain-containing protein n=1 Tax=Flavobacterium silvisoli TaxID=2529433 RepID=UPI001EFFBC65|nr:DUF2279 domain-containing protein [Flavobacterium silvisoli]